MRARAWISALLISSFFLAGAARAEVLDTPWRDAITFTASDRLRFEHVDWFRPPATASPGDPERYAFFANRLRAGLKLTLPSWQAVFELQDTRIGSLPSNASLPGPFGNLGPGAIYYANTPDRYQGETFVKQGYLTFRRSGLAVSAGRMEIADGLETLPGNRTLAWLKKSRISQRLVGPFGYTHVSRSFDAAHASWDRPTWNATAFFGRPTRGGFEVSANRGLDDVTLGGLTLTAKSLPDALPVSVPVDLRGFYLYYRDARDKPVRADNRPIAVRSLDDRTIEVHSGGAHALSVLELGPGKLDLLAWGVLQGGDWGRQKHFAWAHALEVGYRLAQLPAAPWLRFGWNRSSGDSNPGDSRHESFFQVLPTARVYAQTPFFNLMNNEDLFAQLLLEPHPRVKIRADYHVLRLTERGDLWYSGGGATNEKIFGFAGKPSGGDRDLANLLDVGVTLGPWWRTTLSLYYGRVFGRGVVRNIYSGEDAEYSFAELTFRY